MKKFLIIFGVATGLGLTLALVLLWPTAAHVESYETSQGFEMKFRANGADFEMYDGQSWQPFFAKGVNIGAALPGHFPGELAIRKQDYIRWFGMIQEMGANVIRVYTILKPEFYEALVTYNADRDEPLYLIQGVWSPEEQLIEGKDAFDPDVKQQFAREIQDAVDAVYGEANLKAEPHSGKASGKYLFNAGPYLMGWIIGTEWDPWMVDHTNQTYADLPDYAGEHFRSGPQANAFEKWLAEMIDTAARAESKYGWQHPIAFSNWVTTDPLEHPGEPLYEEDMASVDPHHIEVTDWKAGTFASYHVYPYYPDMFTYDENLQTLRNDSGQVDSYKTYLSMLKQYHREMPVMITEYGVPSSQGIAHLGPLGRHQGGHSEQRQGQINAELFRLIRDQQFAGAILFTWQDEWFKKTWNTVYFDQPDRRAYWYNALTNESFFGVLGMYPGKSDVIHIDGDRSDWARLKDKTRLQLQNEAIEIMEVTHDEGYVYLLLQWAEPVDLSRQSIYIGIDTLEGGNRQAPQLGDRSLDEGLEAIIEISEEHHRVQLASHYDVHTRLFRHAIKEHNTQDDHFGSFRPWKLVVNYELSEPDARIEVPFQDVEVGKLMRGYTDPEHPEYNSKAMWQLNGAVLEMRIPWMLLGFSDPSSLSVMNDEEPEHGTINSVVIDGLRLIPWLLEEGTVRGLDGTEPYPVTRQPKYTWEPWEGSDVNYVERPKQSYEWMREAMRERPE